MTSKMLRDLQASRLNRILKKATEQVPAYAGQVSEAMAAADPFEWLDEFPLTSRKELAKRLPDYCADDINPVDCKAVVTSGTSGIPLKLVVSSEHLAHMHATAMRRNHAYGLAIDHKVLRPFWSLFPRWSEYNYPPWGLCRMAEWGPADDDSYLAEMIARSREFRPDTLFLRPSHCLKFQDALATFPGPPLQLHAIQTYGEVLTSAARQRLVEYFGCQIYDLYGMREVGTIAAQCERGAYHIEAERIWLEVVDENGRPVPDETQGEIVITNLVNEAMPLIRYRTGDLGALRVSPCECVRPHKVLSLVGGRRPGMIRLSEDKTVDAFRVVSTIRRYPIERFQVIQESDLSVTILVSPGASFTEAHEREIVEHADAVLQKLVTARIDSTGRRPFLNSTGGKAADFVSLVESGESP
ncbi:AMP-binding protein [Micromonospora sp. NBRC 107095]|uniref:phenylacetate--CoA ligase family protein n=1 Tax=Micromonospora sp. NBRC 107095 TaxID=3032209 RepID=UPI0025560F07|nr:AMP-binding protein [Micromonospora sp. NBRC 107095]